MERGGRDTVGKFVKVELLPCNRESRTVIITGFALSSAATSMHYVISTHLHHSPRKGGTHIKVIRTNSLMRKMHSENAHTIYKWPISKLCEYQHTTLLKSGLINVTLCSGFIIGSRYVYSIRITHHHRRQNVPSTRKNCENDMYKAAQREFLSRMRRKKWKIFFLIIGQRNSF